MYADSIAARRRSTGRVRCSSTTSSSIPGTSSSTGSPRVRQESGFAFVEALSDAIPAATRAVERANPEAFRYRGVSLRGAVERSLFVALSNDEALAAAYGAAKAGEPVTVPAEPTELRSLAAAATLGRLRA